MVYKFFVSSKTLIYLFFIFGLISCNFSNKKEKTPIKNKNTDIFYTENEGLDFFRFPLVKPFDVVSIDKKLTWSIGKGFNEMSAYNTLKLCFYKDIFFGQCGKGTIVNYEEVDKSWIIIQTKKDIVKKSFAFEKDFLDYTKSINVDSGKLVWKTPSDLYKQFKETGCLPWIPNCK